jgi:ATP-dependent Clp protease adaptor protein ClpS
MAARIRYSVPMISDSASLELLCLDPVRSAGLGDLDVRAAVIRNGDDGDGGGDGNRPPGDDGQIGIATKTRAKPKKPSQFKVLMLNDDYTPMEFVVLVLKRFFHMDLEQATRVMLHVHQRGVGVCGIFPYEIAETKVNQVMDFAKQNQHPLQCTLEKA